MNGPALAPQASEARVYQVRETGWLPGASPSPERLARRLPRYVRDLGFTRVELLPAGRFDSDEAAAAALPMLATACADAGLGFGAASTGADDGFAVDAPPQMAARAWLHQQLAPQDDDRAVRFARQRAALALAWALPGAKRVPMGQEFAQASPADTENGLQWHLLADPLHEGLQRLLHDLNHLCASRSALADADTLAWHEPASGDPVLAFVREPSGDGKGLLAVGNLSPTDRPSYRVGVPRAGWYGERVVTALRSYGGPQAAWPNPAMRTVAVPWGGHAQSLVLRLPAFCTLLLEGPC